MAYVDRNWYEHLVDPSPNDYIYTLIHLNLRPDWDPGHDLDFVVVKKDNLPSHLFPKGIQTKQIATSLPIDEIGSGCRNYKQG